TGYLLFDAAFRPSFVARLRLSPRLGRIFFKKQTSNQLGCSTCYCNLQDNTGCLIEHFGNADAVPQPPERCLSRKAGIVRCCPNY
ncbi:MAG: hypothetical protein MR715_08030, partial [Subdoligranulum sp.]|nr:hypothetical protein [Subdoligranulum sp.]